MLLRRAAVPEATTASNSSASKRLRMVTNAGAATSLKYQRQCIEKGEQSLAGWAEEAANEVTNLLICGLTRRAMDRRVNARVDRAGERCPCDFAPLAEPDNRAS